MDLRKYAGSRFNMSENFDFGRKFIPAIKRILGPLIFEEAPLDMDLKEVTDLVLLKARDMRVGCRIRRAGYWDRYPWQFTIRSKLPSGAATELEKIIEGWGDWLFYGHQAYAGSIDVSKWFVIDLHNFRAHLIRRTDYCIALEIPNNDGTYFAAWDICRFAPNPELCVGCFDKIPPPLLTPLFPEAGEYRSFSYLVESEKHWREHFDAEDFEEIKK